MIGLPHPSQKNAYAPKPNARQQGSSTTFARVAEQVDARDSKSRGPRGRGGSSPSPGTGLKQRFFFSPLAI